eukprot:COSAG04_NODE_102_length_26175_cov_14.250163_6_plen_896_part_00
MPASADASLVPAQDAEPDEPGEDTPLLQQLAAEVSQLKAEAAEARLRTELLDQAVGVPKPGASAADKLRLLVMGQVNSKLARFGPTRGTIIASLVLLSNVIFIWAFVAGTTSNCEQRSAIMDPEPMIDDTYTNMFDSGNTHVCASYIHATQVYTPGDTCTVVPSEEEKDDNPSGWLGKNGVCEVDSDRCAPGTDCTDCPTDPLCEPGRDGIPTDTSDTCACQQDDFCCSQWDVACGLCELGFGTTAQDSQFCTTRYDYVGCTTQEAASALLATVASPSLVETIQFHNLRTTGRDFSFHGIRVGTCSANSCSGSVVRVEQLFRNIRDDNKLRLSVLHEEHLADRAHIPDLTDSQMSGIPGMSSQINPAGHAMQWDAQRFPDLAGPLVVTGSLDPLPPIPALADWNGALEEGCAVGGSASPGAFLDISASVSSCDYCMNAYKLMPLEARLPGCGLSSDVADISPFSSYLEMMLGPEMSVHSDSCDRFDIRIDNQFAANVQAMATGSAERCSAVKLNYQFQHISYYFPDWGETACRSGIGPTSCDSACQQQHCSTGLRLEHERVLEHRGCELLPGCLFKPGVCSTSYGDPTSDDSQGACEGAGHTWQAATCTPLGDTPDAGLDGQFWTRGPAQAKIDQCSAFHRLQYDSCFDAGDECLTPMCGGDSRGLPDGAAPVDGCRTRSDCTVRPMGPLYRDGVCQVDTGQCAAGTDCSDCPSDPACPGVGEQRLTPCHLQGVPCDQYVQQDSALAGQCGVPDSLTACADKDCSDPTVSAKKEIAASVLYVTCPKMATQLGVGMGYLFLVEMLAIAATVTGAVLLSGGSFGSAWDQTRSILRGEMATEAAEAATLLDEEKRLGSPSPKEQKKEKVKLGDAYVATPQQKEAKAPGNSTAVAPDSS